MSDTESTVQGSRKLGELIKDVKFAMLTTRALDDTLTSRPLTTLDVDFDGTLWFLVSADSEMVQELGEHSEVNLSYESAKDGHFVSVSGMARATRDPERARTLWNLAAKIWFKGPDDPNLAVLRVDVEKAEYWDTPGGTVERLVGYAKAAITGDKSALGEHGHVELHAHRPF